MTDQMEKLKPLAPNANIGIVISDYYKDISQGLLAGALSVLDGYSGIQYEVARVFGAWEIPLATQTMARTERFQGIIALGCVIRGETSHFDYLCQQCSSALMAISLDCNLPISFGVLTVETYGQAQRRSGTKDMSKNKGCEAATGVIGSLHTVAEIRQNY